MKALLWKDYRLNRMILILGAVLIAGPYVVVILQQWCRPRHTWSPLVWADLLGAACQVSLGLSLVTVAILGCNAFAGERADRSAEFLAYLPPSRRAILMSKAVLSLVAIAAIWGINLAVARGVIPALLGDGSPPFNAMPLSKALAVSAAVGTIMFGMGWGASAFLESTAIAAGVAFFAPAAVAMAFIGSQHWFGWPTQEEFGHCYSVVCVAMGTVGFGVGTVHYLRRVEP